MTRDEALRQIAELHTAWSIEHGDDVPYVAADANPHRGETTDLSIWQADRSAPPEIDDPLNSAIRAILGQVEDDGAALVSAAPVEIEVTPMPWHLELGNVECGERRWAVVRDADGAIEGCHDERADAVEQQAALYAAENDGPDPLTAAAESMTGAMIAFVPSAADLERMAIDGGEPADQLHVTALYLGDGADFDDAAQAEVIEAAKTLAGHLSPIPTQAFAISVFNPDGDSPCLTVGLSGAELAAAYQAFAADKTLEAAVPPDAHEPWIPHVTLVYDPAPEIYFEDARAALGSLTLDRLRVAFAGVVTDIPLGAGEPMTAADVPPVIPEIVDGTPVSGVAVIEGVSDGSGREFAPGVLTWADPPLAIRWPQIEQSEHEGAAIVGRVDEIWRDGNQIRYRGVMDDDGEYGAEAVRLMRKQMLRGVSPMVDDLAETDVEYVMPDLLPELPAGSYADDAVLLPEPDLAPVGEIYHAGRIRSLTILSEPAFVEAFIEIGDTPERPAPIEIEETPLTPTAIVAAGYTITIPELWPEEWFDEPDESEMPPFGAVTITASGRIVGMIAPRQVVHRAFRAGAQPVTVPTRQDYSEFNNKPALVAGAGGEPAQIFVGSLTFDCGHADALDPRRQDPRWARDHYENACSVAARVRAGEHSRTGQPFIAGALMHGMSAEKLERMMGCAVSGDWQAGKFNAALLVPVEGFPRAAPAGARLRVRGGMVASYVPLIFEREARTELDEIGRRHAAREFATLRRRYAGGGEQS